MSEPSRSFVSRPFKMKSGGKKTLKWGVIVRRDDNSPFGLVLYFLPDKQRWNTSYSTKISDKVQANPADSVLFKTDIEVPDGVVPDAKFLVTLLSERDRASAMTAAIRERGK